MTDGLLLEEKDVGDDMNADTIRAATINRNRPGDDGARTKTRAFRPLVAPFAITAQPDRPAPPRPERHDGAEMPLVAILTPRWSPWRSRSSMSRLGNEYTRVYQGTRQSKHQPEKQDAARRANRAKHANERADVRLASPRHLAMSPSGAPSRRQLCERHNVSLESIFVAEPVIKPSLMPAIAPGHLCLVVAGSCKGKRELG